MSSSKRNLERVAVSVWCLVLVGVVALTAPIGCGSSGRTVSSSPAVERALKHGQALYDAHQYAEATDVLMRAMIDAEAEDDLFGRAVCYISISLCQLRLGNTEAAARMLGEAERIMSRLEVEQPNVEPAPLYLLYGRYHEAQAELAKAAADWQQAARHLDQAETFFRRASRS